MINSWLRVEARPLPEGEMFEDQKRVLWLLESAIRWAKENRQPSDPTGKCACGEGGLSERINRILFLHGVSGVGKTSVYLTIRERDEKKNKDSAVWLKPLEFGILKDASNALSDILALIEDEVTKSFGSKTEHRHLSQRQDDCMKALRQLQNRISEVWDGAPAGRAVRIPPQAFAAEVVDVSRMRAKLRGDLNKLIGDVSDCFFDGRLLILPIDDIHEHHAIASEMLRLLRLIDSPRFLTLAIGDIELLKGIERVRIRDGMGHVRSSDPRMADARMAKQVEEQAVFSLSKTVPVAQRFELMPPDPGEDDIDKLVGFVPAPKIDETTLGELMVIAGVWGHDRKRRWKPDVKNCWGREDKRYWLFKVSPRHLVDMYMELSVYREQDDMEKSGGKQWAGDRRERSRIGFAQGFAWRQFDILVQTTGWFDDDEVRLLRGIIRPKTGASDMELEINEGLVLVKDIKPIAGGGLVIVSRGGKEKERGKEVELYHAIQAWLRLTISLIDGKRYSFENDTLSIPLVGTPPVELGGEK